MRFARCVVAFALLLVLSMSVACAVKLKWELVKGDELTYDFYTSSSAESGAHSSSAEISYTVKMHVSNVASDGTMTLTEQYSNIQMTEDSVSTELPDQTGQEQLRPNGESVTTEEMKSVGQEFSLPSYDLSPGMTWTSTRETDAGTGKITTTVTYEYTGTETITVGAGTFQAEKISITDVNIQADETPGLTMQITGSGTIYFVQDVQDGAGFVAKYDASTEMQAYAEQGSFFTRSDLSFELKEAHFVTGQGGGDGAGNKSDECTAQSCKHTIECFGTISSCLVSAAQVIPCIKSYAIGASLENDACELASRIVNKDAVGVFITGIFTALDMEDAVEEGVPCTFIPVTTAKDLVVSGLSCLEGIVYSALEDCGGYTGCANKIIQKIQQMEESAAVVYVASPVDVTVAGMSIQNGEIKNRVPGGYMLKTSGGETIAILTKATGDIPITLTGSNEIPYGETKPYHITLAVVNKGKIEKQTETASVIMKGETTNFKLAVPAGFGRSVGSQGTQIPIEYIAVAAAAAIAVFVLAKKKGAGLRKPEAKTAGEKTVKKPKTEKPAKAGGKWCDKCGKPLQPGAAFCENCGKKA